MFYAWLNDKEWDSIDRKIHQSFKQDIIDWFTKV